MQTSSNSWRAYGTGVWGVSRVRAALKWALLLMCCGFVLATECRAQTAAQTKPKLPPGVDPGGVAIGLLTTGIDYTRPEVAKCVARDGEGELIGWDVVDGDRMPYRRVAAAAGAVVDDALFALVPCGRVRVVPVRVNPADGVSLGKALAFLAQTPARVVVLPVGSQPTDWTAFQLALEKFPELLVMVAAGDEARDLDKMVPRFGGLSHGNTAVVSAAVPDNGKLVMRGATGATSVDHVVDIVAGGGGAGAGRSPTSDAAVLSAVTLVCSSFVKQVQPKSGVDLWGLLAAVTLPDDRLLDHVLLVPKCQ